MKFLLLAINLVVVSTMDNWKLIWHDEFDRNEIDFKNWMVENEPDVCKGSFSEKSFTINLIT